MSNKTCIIISGPTAVGKTAMAVALALKYKTSIISADSRQCYKELTIGVAKPSKEELALVHHYFINSHSIQDEITAAGFEKYALKAVEEIFDKNDLAIMVGGTGLYIKAFCEGLDAIPPVDPSIREAIIQQYEEKGILWLQQVLKEKDPQYFETGEIQNPQRMMRALEVMQSTGHSILHFQKGDKVVRNFNIIKIGITLPREVLYSRINLRVENMLEEGLLDEVKGLITFKQLNALQTVGYSELFDYFDGNCTREAAIDAIKKNTRHYAKRQETWFRKDTSIKSFNFATEEMLIDYLDEKLKDLR